VEAGTLDKVINFCHENLAYEKSVKDYLRGRFISDEMISQYRLGAWPRNIYSLLQVIPAKELKEAHLLWEDHETNREVGKFRNHRLILPIYDVYGTAIGIMGRCIEDNWKERGISKYENTRYSKRSHLFGLNLVKENIRKDNKVLITEGTLDVIKARQHGIDHVVAVLGASLTKQHVILLSRYTDQIFLCFDNDPAGDLAIKRATKKLIRPNINIIEKRVPKTYKDLDQYLDCKYHKKEC